MVRDGERELRLGQLWPPLLHGQPDCSGAQLGTSLSSVAGGSCPGRGGIGRGLRPQVLYPHLPSPVQIIARSPRGAPGGGEGVLGQLGEAEPRASLSRPRALLPLAGGRLRHCIWGGHGWGTRRETVREGHSPGKNPPKPGAAHGEGDKQARPRPLRMQLNPIPPSVRMASSTSSWARRSRTEGPAPCIRRGSPIAPNRRRCVAARRPPRGAARARGAAGERVWPPDPRGLRAGLCALPRNSPIPPYSPRWGAGATGRTGPTLRRCRRMGSAPWTARLALPAAVRTAHGARAEAPVPRSPPARALPARAAPQAAAPQAAARPAALLGMRRRRCRGLAAGPRGLRGVAGGLHCGCTGGRGRGGRGRSRRPQRSRGVLLVPAWPWSGAQALQAVPGLQTALSSHSTGVAGAAGPSGEHPVESCY